MNKRNDFPIFTNNPDLVYLDSAATSQKPQVFLDAVKDFYENYNANIHRGIYPIAEKATHAVEDVRKKVAKFINAKDPHEIIFTNGTTHGINSVMYAWGNEFINKGDVIVTSVAEHHANFVPWQELAKKNEAEFVVIDINNEGELLLDQYKEAFEKAKIVALSYISSVTGRIYDVSQIIRSIRTVNKNCLIIVDAAQAVQFMKVDVQELDCDFLAFSGHKLFAETGVGVLYGKKERLDEMPPFLYGGSMIKEVTVSKTSYATIPEKFEAGTLNISGIISLGVAVDYVSEIGMEKIKQHERELVTYCFYELKKIEGLNVLGPGDPTHRGGIVSFTMDGIHPHDIAQILGDRGICVRAGHHCTMPLHARFGIPASVRVSVSVYNTKKDIDALVAGLHHVKKIFTATIS